MRAGFIALICLMIAGLIKVPGTLTKEPGTFSEVPGTFSEEVKSMPPPQMKGSSPLEKKGLVKIEEKYASLTQSELKDHLAEVNEQLRIYLQQRGFQRNDLTAQERDEFTRLLQTSQVITKIKLDRELDKLKKDLERIQL